MNSNHIEYRGEIFTVTDYNGISVIMDEDGYYNASKICSDNDTQFSNITANKYWVSYIDMLQRLLDFQETPLTKDRLTLSNEVKGVYIHPKLVNFLCIHVDIEYAIKVGEIMDAINERIHLKCSSLEDELDSLHDENDKLKHELESVKDELKTVKDDYDMLNEENTILHENTKNLTNNVNELKTRTVPKNTNNKVLRILIDSEGDMKISANSHWSDRDFERNGFRVVRHYSFPASMNVRQLLRDCKYVSNLYFNPIHLDSIYEIIDSEHPLDEW